MSRPGFTGIGVSVAVCGALTPFKLGLMGEVFAPELLLPLIALVVRFSRHGDTGIREPVFARLLIAGFVTLAGYVLSDLIQGSRPDQFLRGWGRVGLVISDFISLAIIFGQDRRNLWWYSLGAGLGSILFLRLASHAPLALWKFGYAEPVLQASAALGAFVPATVASIWIGMLGVFSMFADFRSFAAICLAVAALVWLRAGRKARLSGGSRSSAKLLVAGAAAASIILVTLAATGGTVSARRNESDAGRRAAFETGVEAVIRSPFVGHGSWAESRELSAMYLNRVNELQGNKGSASVGKQTAFNPHSQILHAWFEGGILGTAFLVAILVQLVRQGSWLLTRRPFDALTPLLLYFAMMTTWNLLMSPFSAPHRLGIAIGAAIVVVMRVERRRADVAIAAAPALAAAADRISKAARAADHAGRCGRQINYASRRLHWKRAALCASFRPT